MTIDSFSPKPSLDCLPDTITLYVMGKLDIVSLIRLARTCKRFYHLHREEKLWTNVDMTTLPPLDVRKIKKVIENYISPKLEVIRIQSNFQSSFQSTHSKKPKIDTNVLDFLVRKCPSIKDLQILNCDLSETLKCNKDSSAELLNCSSLERVSLWYCKTPLLWLSGVKWPSLRHLSLAYSVMTSHSDVRCIMESKDWHGTLKCLDLTGCYRVSSLGESKGVYSIERLDLSGTSINDNALTSLEKFLHLKELILRNCRCLTDNGILKLPSLPLNLQLIDITDNPQLSPLVLEQLHQTISDTQIKLIC